MTTPAPRESAPGWSPLAAMADALRYPWRSDALATSTVLLACYGVGGVLPVLGGLVQLIAWLGLYKYALEVLASSAEGSDRPPQGWSAVDAGVQSNHYWLQLFLLLVLVVITHLAPEDLRVVLLGVVALLLPGMVLGLAIGQNLWSAVNPLAWVSIAGRLGTAYALLALASWALLWLQSQGEAWVAGLPLAFLVGLGLVFLTQMLTLSLFRLMGLAMRPHAEAFGIQRLDRSKPVLARDRQQSFDQQRVAQALQTDDLAERAAQLAPQLAAGAADELHREYRRCLRVLGQRSTLDEHARRRVCELLNLNQPKLAVALANEALADDANFCAPDADHSLALARAAERMNLMRQAAQLLANYRAAYPRRYDGLPLAMLAAEWFADRLNQPEVAMKLLRQAQPLTAAGEQSARFAAAIERLQRGQPLSAPSGTSP